MKQIAILLLLSCLLLLLVAEEVTWLLSRRLFIRPILRVGTALLSYLRGPMVDRSCICERERERETRKQ